MINFASGGKLFALTAIAFVAMAAFAVRRLRRRGRHLSATLAAVNLWTFLPALYLIYIFHTPASVAVVLGLLLLVNIIAFVNYTARGKQK